MAVAQASAVLPTPPFPVKNRKRVGCSKKLFKIPVFDDGLLLITRAGLIPWFARGAPVPEISSAFVA